MPTISQSIAEGAARLRASGIDHERRTAGLLLCHLLGIDRTHLLTRSDEQIDEAHYREYLLLIERRAAGEPVQYLTGHQEFYGLDFLVTPDVLIPRPETEFLIEQVIRLLRGQKQDSPLIVDIGTGSGCIAVTLARELPGSRVIATDSSAAALDIARKNAARLEAINRIQFLEGDLMSPLAQGGFEGAVDILASNPPYVDQDGREGLQREVRDWEPHTALFGGIDGLDFYRRLLDEGTKYVKKGGYLVVEIGYGQLDPITNMTKGSRWELVEVSTDLQDIPRVLTFRLSDKL